MTVKITFDPSNQSNIVSAAAQVVMEIEPSLPKVPWLSNSGQQDAFRRTVELVYANVGNCDADGDAKSAIIFWALTLLYANNRSFRLATASVKNWDAYAGAPIVSAFVDWVGTNNQPNQIIAANILEGKLKGMFAEQSGKVGDHEGKYRNKNIDIEPIVQPIKGRGKEMTITSRIWYSTLLGGSTLMIVGFYPFKWLAYGFDWRYLTGIIVFGVVGLYAYDKLFGINPRS